MNGLDENEFSNMAGEFDSVSNSDQEEISDEFFGGELLFNQLEEKFGDAITRVRSDIEEIRLFAAENGVKLEILFETKAKDYDFTLIFPSHFTVKYSELKKDKNS